MSADFMPPIDPSADQRRLEVLASYRILDTPAEAAFNRLAHLSADVFDVPLAAVTFMTQDEQWFKACVGAELQVNARSGSFCQALFEVGAPDVLVVPDTLADDRFKDFAVVSGFPFLRFYAGAPLVSPEGVRIGTLCLYDVVPRPDLNSRERLTLQRLADQVMSELELRRALLIQVHERQRYAALMASAMDGMMILNTQGVVIDWNPATEAMLGYTQAEAAGRELTDVMVPPEMHVTHRAALADVVERRDVQQQRVEVPALRKDGTRFPAEFTIAPFDLAGTMFFAVSMRDLTEVTAARDALRASHHLLHTVVESLPDAVYVKDTGRRYTLINAAGAARIGRSVTDILGRTDDELFPPQAATESRRRDDAVLSTGQSVSYEVTDLGPSGTCQTYLSTKMALLDADHHVAGLVGVSIDITERKDAQEIVQAHNELLTAQVEQAQLEILERLSRAAEYRDDDTGEHMLRVGKTAAGIARALGLPPEQVDLIERAAPMHDVGKIGVPDALLLKPGRLTPEEFEVIKTHASIGAGILSGGQSPVVVLAAEIALTHHERWDGQGYPQGLMGQEIPISGRIAAVADVLDALTSERPYKRAWTLPDALTEIHAQAGKQFDPQVVEALDQYLSRSCFETGPRTIWADREKLG
ncbi:HD domain-containing phosphohydrolase [Deinococcus sp.]|uniref:HD domain-containing phosphohydrolase n=3 Tax=unclassified Deinococcus TaxID=2623546 RepID=UPI00391B7FDA